MHASSVRSLSCATLAVALYLTVNVAAAVTPGTPPVGPVENSSGISVAALAKAQQKLAHATQIADQFAGRAAASGLPEAWRAQLVNRLMQAPESQFDKVSAASTVQAAMLLDLRPARSSATSSSIEPKVLGDLDDDLVYLPFNSPCRIVDTRPLGAGGPLQAGSSTDFRFAQNVASQGGSPCSQLDTYISYGYPGAAAANITVVSTASAVPGSFLRANANNSTSTTSWLNFGPSQTIANQGILPINLATGLFTIFVNGTTQVIVDIFGVFGPPAPTGLNCETVEGGITIPQNSAGRYAVTATCSSNKTAVAVNCDNLNNPGVLSGGSSVGGTPACNWINTTASPQSVGQSIYCCGVPGVRHQ